MTLSHIILRNKLQTKVFKWKTKTKTNLVLGVGFILFLFSATPNDSKEVLPQSEIPGRAG